MKTGAIVQLEADLKRFLRLRKVLMSLEIDGVVLELHSFTSAVTQKGFRKAVIQLLNDPDIRMDRPFIEVCDAVIRYHRRNLDEIEGDLVSKSLFEAYLYLGGTEYAFEPPAKT